MASWWPQAFCGLILMTLAGAVRADIPPEVLDQGKRSTVLVEIGKENGFGSAFCIDASGFFITNNHVVAERGNDDVNLVVRSGEKDQRTLRARVVRTDPDLDLALLWVDKPGQMAALHLADADGLIETESIAAFGYPFGKDLSLSNDEYPSITVSTGHITSLRKIHGELKAIQIDAVVNPGNSGGPVLNSKGQVIGVVVASIRGSGINFAIPASDLAHFLESVSVVLSPGKLIPAQLQGTQSFVIKVAAFQRSTADMTAELTLSTGPNDHRTFTAHTVDANTFEVKAPPFPAPAAEHMLTLTVKEGQTELTCQARDQRVIVGGKSTMLSALSRIERGDTTIVTFADKEIREASVLGLEDIEADVFGAKERHNFSRAESITITPDELPALTLTYHVVVRRAGKTVGEQSGRIPIDGSSDSAPRAQGSQRSDVELLISSYDSDQVKRFDGRNGQFIDDFASGNDLSHPTGITIGPDGNLYVGSEVNSAIYRFNGGTGQFIDDFISSNAGVEHPCFLMFGPDGNLYVAAPPHAVKRFNGRTGAYMGDFVSGNEIDTPQEFCFGPDGRFYLGSYNTRQVKRFDGHTGAFIDNFITPAAMGKGEPVGVHFGPDGNLYVSTGANEVRRFNGKTGAYIDTFASGNGLNYPIYMIFRPSPSTRKPATH